MRLCILFVGLFLSLSSPAHAIVGEQHRTVKQPSATLRDANKSSDLRVTIWYPARAGAPTSSIDIPKVRPLFSIGSVANDAPFADNDRRPVVLLSHGYGGSARIMAWFGMALADRGYVVVAVDHPGNNGLDPQTAAGSVLWWDRGGRLEGGACVRHRGSNAWTPYR